MAATSLCGRLVELCPLRSADAAAVHAILSDRRATRWLPVRVRNETGAQFVRRVLQQDRKGDGVAFSIRALASGEVIGQIRLFHLSPQDRSAEVGYFLRRSSWGNGFATEALRLACRYGFGPWKLHRISALVVAGNDASRAVLEHAGFRLEGTERAATSVSGRWTDVWALGLLRGELRQRGPAGRGGGSASESARSGDRPRDREGAIVVRPRPRVHRPGARAGARRPRSDRRSPLRPRPEGRPVHPRR
ncbi:MAG: GNAT family N-acetyltransferase [Thermoplasmata archaeon]|jgi:RimJ/RimL family protein N-acetyltransferase|nr:GNAT family N-acetyltransferase [Thermoplasmata archaeon]